MTKPDFWLYTAWLALGTASRPFPHTESVMVVPLRAWHIAKNKTGSDPTPAWCRELSEHPWAAMQVLLGSSLVFNGPAQVLMQVLHKKSVGERWLITSAYNYFRHPPRVSSPCCCWKVRGSPHMLWVPQPSIEQKPPTFWHWAPTLWTVRDGVISPTFPARPRTTLSLRVYMPCH